MLRKIVKPALSVFSLVPKAALFNTMRTSFQFASDIQVSSNLRGLLDKEIKYEQENAENLSERTTFFETQGFKVAFDGLQVELSKKIGLYNVRIIFLAKTPMGQDAEEEGQQPQQEGNEEVDYAEISAFIKKDGASKWLNLEFAANSKQSQLTTASFIDDYETEKAERKKGRIYQSGYLGPELSSLDQKLEEGIYSFIESVGVTNELLCEAFQFSIAYEHQFYVKWLKDLKSLV